ncbi:hypothetical protein [Marichromatium bheemlicum]|uniref:Uncharacterized protein n=1 Tax=Marichromatium bheemlicum TaxID=365339 RepID=A0ABX1I2Z2_9GAMM|nr:hypothetical protein [Marichromatium bheemlicum]NKN31783.1 hypothetical protein [Marichromatium bheemlicum]
MSTSKGQRTLGWLTALTALLALIALGAEIGPPVAETTPPGCRACP